MAFLDSFRPKWRRSNPTVRLSAVKELTAQALLARVVKTDPAPEIRLAAVEKLTDQAVLTEVAKLDRHPGVSMAAINRLVDQALLAQVARGSRAPSVCEAAVGKLTDQALLVHVAKTGSDPRVRKAAMEKVTDQAVLAEIAATERAAEVRGGGPDAMNEEDYVRRCMEAAYSEEKEERTFRSDPAFQRVLDPLNSEQYSAAIKAAESLLPRFPDFDLPYHWLASACRSTGNLQRSKAVLAQGLAQAKRKSVLLTDMGETEWQLGNIHQAVYSWCQALHCSSRAIDYNVYLLVSYVAQGLGLAAEAALFLRRVDELRTGTVRLPAALANRLAELARRSRTPALVRVIEQIARKYLANPAAAQAAPAKAGTVGEVLDRVLLEARQELDAGDQKRLAETLVALCTHEFAAPELRRALGHPDPRIRQWCERFVKAILVE